MKNIFTAAIALMLSLPAFSQNDNSTSAKVSGTTFINPIRSKDKIQGSPYLQHMFSSAMVEKLKSKAYMRYNTFNDEFEFINTKGDTLILDKIEDYSSIIFTEGNKKYLLTAYTNTKNKLYYGYLINLYEKNGYGLFQKENINFYEGKKARTTLEKDMPSRYSKTDDTYFFKNKELGISEFPDGKKDLIKLFPDKKAAIEAFVKENKIDFDQQADMIKIIDFLAAQ
ncbi:MAG TPA: hypothetical protein VK528_11910 [Flavobacterium sp.]|nr:hypothetical protein [Flavobacterium sp.]